MKPAGDINERAAEINDFCRMSLAGSSPAMYAVRSQLRRISAVDATVLIEGETGTGKELAARAVHYLGTRGDRPFVPVNCGALSDTLVESELFGHERGAFTDAKTQSMGLVGQAEGGTLFLDEVEVLSHKAQAVLLRFLQDRCYRRVGGTTIRQADVRIIAASNRDLEEMARTREFRPDLLYRLNLLSVRMPTLRERGEDFVELAQQFLSHLSDHYRKPAKHLHPASLAFLRAHTWPGNVRELENLIHREFLMNDGNELLLGSQHVAPPVQDAAPLSTSRFREAKAHVIAKFERDYVREMMNLTKGNVSQAARFAGKERSAFGRLLRKHGMGRSPLQSED